MMVAGLTGTEPMEGLKLFHNSNWVLPESNLMVSKKFNLIGDVKLIPSSMLYSRNEICNSKNFIFIIVICVYTKTMKNQSLPVDSEIIFTSSS